MYMPYIIRKLRNKDEYIIKNKNTKRVMSKHSSLKDAMEQVRLLDDIEFKKKVSTMTFPIVMSFK